MSGVEGVVTEVLRAHRPYGMDCKCGRPINSDADWARHADDAVTEALGLTEERRETWRPGYKSHGQPLIRWVSPWVAVERGEQP